MTNIDSSDHCPICLAGVFVKRMEEVDFLQWTDKGPVRCRVTILITSCQQCDYRTWDGEAEAQMRDAVRRKYDQLP